MGSRALPSSGEFQLFKFLFKFTWNKKIKECEVLCGQWMAVLRKPESSCPLYHIEEDSRNAMGDEYVLFSVWSIKKYPDWRSGNLQKVLRCIVSTWQVINSHFAELELFR